MAHQEQKNFCLKIKNLFPQYFEYKNVLDVGSLDINGNNCYLFDYCSYVGLDIGEGKNVHIVSKTHEYNAPDEYYSFIISTECFEHDMYYADSLKNIIRMLKSDSMFLFTCATDGRAPHGIITANPQDAPLLTDSWANYYKNLNEKDIREVLDIENIFKFFAFEVNSISHDLYFCGIKK